jgi:hypothetical protein
MGVLKAMLERAVANWLRRVVDIDQNEPSLWRKPPRVSIRFRVVTPAIQQALDRSA